MLYLQGFIERFAQQRSRRTAMCNHHRLQSLSPNLIDE